MDKIENDDRWARENHQRNMIMEGLKGCKGNDIILISDVDEIVHPDAIREIKNRLYSKYESALVCNQKLYHYFLNRKSDVFWLGSVAADYLNLKRYSPQYFRDERFRLPNIMQGGWHFSSMGGAERIVQKIEACVPHTDKELSEERRDPSYWNSVIHKNLLLVPIDSTYPSYVRENLEYLKDLGFIDSANF